MHSVLGVFGGTFDPIHCGHLELARELRETLGLSAIRFVPAGDPPHRSAPAASAAQRLAMVELAVANHPGLEVDAREIERTGRSFTVTTLEELRREDGRRALALVVGADAFLGLPTWHRWREIFGLAHLVVVARPGVAIDDRMAPELASEWTLTNRLGLATNFDVARPVADARRYTELAASASFGFELSPKLSAFAEAFGFAPEIAGAKHTSYLDSGVAASLSPNLQIDIRGGVGLNGAGPDYFVGAGLARRW